PIAMPQSSAHDGRLCAMAIQISICRRAATAKRASKPLSRAPKELQASSMDRAMQNALAPATSKSPTEHFQGYSRRLCELLHGFDWAPVVRLAEDLRDCWRTGRQVFLCGNGGSAGHPPPIANAFLYPVSKRKGSALRVRALTENAAVLTCLGNDEGYDEIFSFQLAALANKGDLLLVFSGSGNSRNVVKALEEARRLGMKSYAI